MFLYSIMLPLYFECVCVCVCEGMRGGIKYEDKLELAQFDPPPHST